MGWMKVYTSGHFLGLYYFSSSCDTIGKGDKDDLGLQQNVIPGSLKV